MIIPKNVNDQIVEISQKSPCIKKVVLFGSRAYGDNKERSDIDLAVFAPEISQREWAKFIELIDESLETLLKIDLVLWETAPEKLKEEIKKCHYVLYEK
ncbi:nucleotidyltransferase [Anaerobacillus alkalilacustris]|uniref:Nucleotidyltransferase n=1 Tax=Anaerobacillus alkalilacustris TaxID=393763 RepID=A0A1S2LZ35_9BACI|nr:nucleotidyltransferase domain-containing protein [Anaerobacillus alkalilacustris]OIJ17606.1 nucleotidyltransferase [Anaerobacillus alkalilacustris]